MLVAGGVAFAVSAALSAASVGFVSLLVALVVGNPASGAFVSVAQATLMDLDPVRRETNMARWTLAGSFGYVGGPVLLTAAVWLGVGWRGALLALAAATVPALVAARRVPIRHEPHADGVVRGLRAAFGALREQEVRRWLLLLETSDLLGDVLHGFLALYLVDVGRARPVAAGLGVAIWTGASLVGDALLVPVLRRASGTALLRRTAAGALLVYPAFLLAPSLPAKLALLVPLGLLNAGWYAIPKAGLYAALPGRSGAAIALGGLGGLAGAVVPLGLGVLAGAVGLAPTMWLLLAAPLGLLALVPRTASSAKVPGS